jgi:hypothetical protein
VSRPLLNIFKKFELVKTSAKFITHLGAKLSISSKNKMHGFAAEALKQIMTFTKFPMIRQQRFILLEKISDGFFAGSNEFVQELGPFDVD